MGSRSVFVAIPPRKSPQLRWVTPLLVLLCCISFAWMHGLPPQARREWLLSWGTLGITFAPGMDLGSTRAWLRMLSGIFLHSDWTHLTGNLVFLMIFGLPAERLMGSGRFLLLFLSGGIVANLAAAISVGHGNVVIGASGAVSAVLGAWLALFPRARLGVVLPLGLFLEFVRAPAALLIGLWALLQALFAWIGTSYGQVAWVAHLAGFGFGGMFALLSRQAIARRMRRLAGY